MASFASKSLKLLRFSSKSALYRNPKYVSGWTRNEHTLVSSAGENGVFRDFSDEQPDFDDHHAPNDSKMAERETALRNALAKLQGEFGKESMLSLHRFFGARRAPVISTGSLKLDQALGIGGLPKGRIIELYGQESSGKTTLALHVIKEAQKLGGYCAFLDAENALNPTLAEAIGVDIDNLLISQPDSAESLLCMVDTLTKSGAISVIVVDSVAALVPQHDIDSESCLPDRELHARIMNQALRRIHYTLCNSKTLVIFINQIRHKPKSADGVVKWEEVTSGGNALKFYAAVRLRISRKELLKTGDMATGLRIIVQVVKNKLAPSMEKAELDILFGKGIWCVEETLDLACEHGVIHKDENGYFIKGKILDRKKDALKYLAADRETLDSIITTLRSHLFQNRLV